MARIGLIDCDSHNFPSLPLMKISAWHKQQGDEVGWYDPWQGIVEPYDKVYMSKVFSFTPDYQVPIYADEISKGGSGYCIEREREREVYHAERDKNLPDEVEHIYPDYSLYPSLTENCSYGFLTRGCPRGCSFCHVAAKEGRCSHKVADLDEFWKGQKEIVLCDPNLLASQNHMDLLQQLVDSKARIDINQGMDIRLVTDRNLELIRQLKMKVVHFAWDRYEDKELIVPKLKLFREATGWGRHNVMVYILVNFDSTLEEDLERIYTVRDIGFDPYVMVYDKEHCDLVYKRLQRWCNNKWIFRATSTFEEYDGKKG